MKEQITNLTKQPSAVFATISQFSLVIKLLYKMPERQLNVVANPILPKPPLQHTLRRMMVIFVGIFILLPQLVQAQTAVTSYSTTTVASTESTVDPVAGYTTGAAQYFNLARNYSAFFGTTYSFPATTGASTNFLTGFAAGGSNFTPVAASASAPFTNVNMQRVDNVAYTGARFSGFFEYSSVRDGVDPDVTNTENYNVNGTDNLDVYIKPTAKYTMADMLNNFSLAYGGDNVFSNWGLGNAGFQTNSSATGNNIERVDLVYSPGIAATTATSLTQLGFLINERNGNDAFKVAAITSIDGSGNVTGLGTVLSVGTGAWGIVGPLVSTVAFMGAEGFGGIKPKELVGMTVANIAGPPTTQRISGIYFSLSALGISAGTRVYGIAVFPNDITTNYLSLSGSPSNTNDASNGGGLDLMSANLLARTTTNFDVLAQTLSGKIWNDANGDGISTGENNVSGNNTSSGGSVTTGGNLYVNIVNAATGNVIAVVQVNADGTYSYPGMLPNFNYELVVTTTPGTVGSSITPAPPSGWVNTNDNLNGTIDNNSTTVLGEIAFTSPFGNNNVINQNFGIQQPPTTVTGTVPSQTNPGGTTSVTVPPTYFDGNDQNGGTITSITITTFPTNATSITIGTTTYYPNAASIPAVCPTASCAVFPPAGVILNGAQVNGDGQPTVLIAIDPIDGAVTPVITYTVTDNAGAISTQATVNVPFLAESTDLAVTKVASSLTPVVGSTVTFTITATNNGPSLATGVTVSDNIPAGYTVQTVVPSAGIWSAPSWTIGNLAAGASATLTVTATVNFAGPYANTATISGNETDPVPGNNTDTETPVPTPLCLSLNLWVYLEGSLIDVQGVGTYTTPMRTTLNNNRLLPGQSKADPFTGTQYIPKLGTTNSVYTIAPWNYTGTEGDGFDSGGDPLIGQANYSADITDWVLVSLRTNPANGSEKLCQRAGLLHSDGTIEFVNPLQNCCPIDPAASYYVVVEHRNHLIVMSHQAVPVVNGTLTYDFRNKESYVNNPFGSTYIGQKQVLPGVYCMYGGNGDQTSGISADTDINSNDLNKWDAGKNRFRVYSIPDYNMNGDVNTNDKNLWFKNTNKLTSVPRQ